ncbi:type I methionyl aminopeptidase [Maioricimonas rarisocia]|uniref:type I methionyl aminopeptidase n=1 Tax=Maioricimonas rarisocia TaxID=2528026 RepID=UPI0011A091BD|nr:type I methionyl aminopeptidase [Maioricimonas rarisocia]
MITLKSRREIRLMRDAGQLVAQAHRIVRDRIAPGVTTGELDAAVEAFFNEEGATPLFKGVPGTVPFPAVTCMSVNEQIVHGIPGDYVLQEGDLLSVDTGCRINGWCGDAAWTYRIGQLDDEKTRLADVGAASIDIVRNGLEKHQKWSQVAAELMALVDEAGFSLVRDFVGHGIGREMHEAPQVPNYFDKRLRHTDFEIRPGLVLAIEPMINAGSYKFRVLDDHWTAVTVDGRPSVHFEHTFAVTANGVELLTEGVGESD